MIISIDNKPFDFIFSGNKSDGSLSTILCIFLYSFLQSNDEFSANEFNKTTSGGSISLTPVLPVVIDNLQTPFPLKSISFSGYNLDIPLTPS